MYNATLLQELSVTLFSNRYKTSPNTVSESNRGESLFTIFASLTYAYHYLLTLIGKFHDGVIWLRLPEFISFFFSYLNFVIPEGCPKQKA